MPPPVFYFAIGFFITLSLVGEVISVSSKDLRARLLQDYDPAEAPPKSNYSYMYYSVELSSVRDVVERQGYIFWQAGFSKSWGDSRLSWNKTIEKQRHLHFKKGSIWLPNPFFFYNRVQYDESVFEAPVYASSKGYLTSFLYTQLRTVCTFDLRQFPFDRQQCHIIMGSRIDEYEDKANFIYMDFVTTTSRWHVVKGKAIRRRHNHFGEEIELFDTTFTLERRTALVSTSIICPLLFNVIVSLLPFWMTTPTSRLALGGASLFLGTAIFWKLNELLPLDGYAKPFLAHYCILALTISLLSLVYGVVKCTLTKRAPVAFLMTFVSKVTRPLPALFCLPSTTAAKDTPTEERGLASFPKPESGAISWSDTLAVIDKLTFAICSVVYFLATVTVLATLSAAS